MATEHSFEEGKSWAFAAIEVGKYFMIRSRFIEARNYFTVAQYVLYLCQKCLQFILEKN